MPPVVGLLLFVIVIGALFAATYMLSSRYGRGTDRRRVRDITREIALRDGNVGIPTGGLPPYPNFGNDDPSPRDRLRRPPDGD